MNDETTTNPELVAAAPLYAEIAVAMPVYQAYTYLVPPALADVVQAGTMVRVPVRKRFVEGVVLALSDKTTTPVKRLKEIAEVLTPDYAIAPDLLDLSAWMAEYYLCGRGEALGSIAFFGLSHQKPREERRVCLANPVASVSETPDENYPKLTKRQKDVAEFFLKELNEPLTRAELCRRVQCSPGVVDGLLEKGVLTKQTHKIERRDAYNAQDGEETPHDLSAEQRAAFDQVCKAIDEGRFESSLLYGVTGSGKTEVYLQAISHALGLGRQAIVLVPEISLTPQAVERFRLRFGPRVGVYHSGLSRGQKYDLWQRIASGSVRVLIGARSAIFAPFPRLGLIVVDEEHENSYKQGDPAPRYHARDVAVWRAYQAQVPVLLGSATPSLESLLNARDIKIGGRGKYKFLELTERAGEAQMPEIHLVDMAAQVRDERATSLISTPLERAITLRLERKEQVVLFLNRRGFSNFLLCLACKTAVKCDHCDVVMTWHKAIHRLMCHFCGTTRARPAECPECGTPNPAEMGAGTQRIEEDLAEMFPTARVLRIDQDTTRGRNGFLRLWEKIERGEADILLGTQMIAKGLHLERVTLVGVISADSALFLPDFRSAERAFAQMTQVAGRSGRMKQRGEVFIQTFVPRHYGIQRAINQDAEGFWDQELHIREMLRFPPYWRLLLLRLSGEDAKHVAERAERLAGLLRRKQYEKQDYRSLSILGAAPSPIGRIQDKTRWQVIMRGQNPALMRALLLDALALFEKDKGRTGVHLTIDMDPMDLL